MNKNLKNMFLKLLLKKHKNCFLHLWFILFLNFANLIFASR